MQFVPPIAGGVTAITILIVIYVMFNLHVIEDK